MLECGELRRMKFEGIASRIFKPNSSWTSGFRRADVTNSTRKTQCLPFALEIFAQADLPGASALRQNLCG